MATLSCLQQFTKGTQQTLAAHHHCLGRIWSLLAGGPGRMMQRMQGSLLVCTAKHVSSKQNTVAFHRIEVSLFPEERFNSHRFLICRNPLYKGGSTYQQVRG